MVWQLWSLMAKRWGEKKIVLLQRCLSAVHIYYISS